MLLLRISVSCGSNEIYKLSILDGCRNLAVRAGNYLHSHLMDINTKRYILTQNYCEIADIEYLPDYYNKHKLPR